MDSRGYSYIVSYEAKSSVVVFDRSGNYVRTIGRRGSGPGEYRAIGHIGVAPGDTLWLFDQGHGRVSIISPAWQFVRSWDLPGGILSSAPLGYDLIAFSGRVTTSAALGQPVHIAARSTGKVVRSFGLDTELFRPDMYYSFQRYIAASKSGGVWIGHHTRYVVEQWDTIGRRLKKLQRDANWFPPYERQRQMTRETPEFPGLIGIREPIAGQLWVLVRVNEPRWYRGLGGKKNSSEGQYYPIQDGDRVFGSRVEVIDTRNGVLLASIETDEHFFAFLNDSTIASYREDDGGAPRFTLWKYTLDNKPRRR